MYLLDTNVISEVIKRESNKSVLAWLDDVSIQDTYISVITIGAIRKGI
jgi:predicted nucleic acid-binding protein